MDEIDRALPDREGAKAMLDRLAASLGCSTEAFFDPALTEEGQTLEFLHLWLTIEDGQDRAKVLTLMRSLRGNVQASGEPVALAHAMQKPEDGS